MGKSSIEADQDKTFNILLSPRWKNSCTTICILNWTLRKQDFSKSSNQSSFLKLSEKFFVFLSSIVCWNIKVLRWMDVCQHSLLQTTTEKRIYVEKDELMLKWNMDIQIIWIINTYIIVCYISMVSKNKRIIG